MSKASEIAERIQRERLKAREPVPGEWAVGLYIQRASTKDHLRVDELNSKLEANGGKEGAQTMANFLVYCIADDTGDLALTEEDAPILLGLPLEDLKQVFEIACKINGMGQKAVEDAAKNCESGESAALSSSLPEPSTTAAPTNSPSA